ncbi:pyridoxamine 5'-phosphate oxidase family protein [Acidisphaera sp. L21]|uniref:pyridoxamine 5'-phosphate oxidase family protein n=1 Tax=Acidisphaera sp. L21 TaxID=1641851 RepID=UPI00131C2650|nr:pyridoxamine 5'-phosphate oxidase family protein [Acidisphaera sp. L21]
MTETNNTAKLWDLIKSVEVAMMVTEDGGHLRSRPMAMSQKEFDGTLWFFTRADSHKVTEVQSEQRVNLAFAHPGKQDYVSVSGTAALVRDAKAVEDHWTESLKVWFPKGKADPEIALLKVTVQQAEYWDAPSSTMLHAYGYVKAALTGESPNPGGHGTVKLS